MFLACDFTQKSDIVNDLSAKTERKPSLKRKMRFAITRAIANRKFKIENSLTAFLPKMPSDGAIAKDGAAFAKPWLRSGGYARG